MSFDPTKPVQTRLGQAAKILATATEAKDQVRHWGLFEAAPGHWLTREWDAYGQFDRLNRDDPDQVACDIVNVEEPCA